MSPDSDLLSWRDLRSTPDRRSPVSCFSSSDRVSVPDRRSFEARLSAPDRFSSLPIVVSVGLPRIMLDRPDYSMKAAREACLSGSRLVQRVPCHLSAVFRVLWQVLLFLFSLSRQNWHRQAKIQPMPRCLVFRKDLDQILCWREQRKVSHQLVVNYSQMKLTLKAEGLAIRLRGKMVDIYDFPDGRLEVRWKGQVAALFGFRQAATCQSCRHRREQASRRDSGLDQGTARSAAAPQHKFQRGHGAQVRRPVS